MPDGLVVLCFLLIGMMAALRCTASAEDEPAPSGVQVDPDPGHPASEEYARYVAKLIKTAWSELVTRSDDIPFGTAVIHLSVDRQGQVAVARVVSDSSGERLGQSGLRAAGAVKLLEMPDEAVRELKGKRLGLDITFELLPDQDVHRKRPAR